MAKHRNTDPRDAGNSIDPAEDVPALEDILVEFDLLDAPETSGEAESDRQPAALPEGEAIADVFTHTQTVSGESADAPTAVAVTESAPVKRPAPKKRPADAPKKKSASKGKRRRKSRRKKKDRFKTGLIVYLAILGLLFLGLLVALWIGLDRSQQRIDAENEAMAQQRAEQAAQKAHERAVYRAPQLAFESWLSGADAEYWTEQWYADKTDDLDGRDRVKAYLADLFTTAEAFKALDYTAERPLYVLKNGDTRLAEIALSGSDVNWSVSDVKMLVEGHEKASVRVASGSRVYCNGVALGKDYVVDSSSYFDYEELRDKLINPITWDTYEVSGLLLPPELRADPPEGGIVTETKDGDFLLCLDSDSGKPYQTRAVNFVKSYLYYFMSGYNGTWGNLYAALAYLTPGYPAYKNLQDTYNGVVWNTAYANIDTSRTSAADVVIWADNCYSVDVSYDAKCTLNGQNIDYEAATLRIYFLKTDAGYIISNFETL